MNIHRPLEEMAVFVGDPDEPAREEREADLQKARFLAGEDPLHGGFERESS